jgi:hypothetical protein
MSEPRTHVPALALWLLTVGLALPAAGTQIGPAKFDHLTTGFELLNAHLNVPCESCHVGAVFKGTPRDCASCHRRGARITATFKPQTHVLSTDRCDACHTDVAWNPASRFDHREVQGSCATCHNGVIAVGKPANHIASSNQCDACHSIFGWNPVVKFDHSLVTGSCSTCHNGTIATGKPGNHIPTSDDCSTCHSTIAWLPANGMHNGNISNCVACHNGTIATGKSATHIASSNLCSACHSTATWTPAVKVDHTQVVGSCSSCHNGTIATGLPVNHFPTSQDCGVCHLSTTAFGPGTAMNHKGITSNCSSCHETGMSWVGVTMVDRPTAAQDASHPTTGECSNCHASTVSFTLGVNAKPANHIPTSQPCTLCHTNPNDYTVYAMNHTGITGNCILCHGTGLSFANIVPKEPPANHIPTGSIPCESCHAAAVFTTFSGTPMNHTAVAAMACDACHETGMSWFGVKVQDRPKGHHTGQDCKNCHGTSDWGNAKGGSIAPGPGTRRTAQAITSGSDAATSTALAGTATSGGQLFAHTGTGGNCAACHNGVNAAGKGAAHVQSNNSCDNCHTTIAWMPARFEHQGVAPACAACHDAIHATGRPATHVRTALACGTCHSTIAWMPAIYLHTGVGGSCQTCHNGAGAGGKSAGHMLTALDCATCHNTSTWFTVAYRHAGLHYPGDHAADLNCVNCHTGNTNQVAWPFPAEAPACAACHERNYQPAPHPKYGNVKYTARDLQNCTGSCHVYSDATLKTITKFRPGPQHRVNSGQF